MDILVVYTRCDAIQKNNPAKAVVIDSVMSSMVKRGVTVEVCVMKDEKQFFHNSQFMKLNTNTKNILIIGTIPYYILVANLYAMKDQGYNICINPDFIITGKKNAEYPDEFLQGWEV